MTYTTAEDFSYMRRQSRVLSFEKRVISGVFCRARGEKVLIFSEAHTPQLWTRVLVFALVCERKLDISAK
jgi:hypothetical protein